MSIDLSLDRIRALVSHLPPYTRPTCHIAGTNGKGSVSAILSSIFAAAGYTVGRFNSPHLVHVRDSIVLNNAAVSLPFYNSKHAEICKINDEHACGASSFELLTVTALQIFEAAKVEVVVLEVGMGGRLDATNVIPDSSVLVSALTAVDLDHQAFLGNTITDITKEKAAIARRGRPFVLGPQSHGEVQDVVRAIVDKAGGRLIIASPATTQAKAMLESVPLSPQALRIHLSTSDHPLDLELPLHGNHQRDNLGTAMAVLDAVLSDPGASQMNSNRLTMRAIASGVRDVSWPGRLSWHTVPVRNGSLAVLADGAHNAASSRTLATYIVDIITSRIRPRATDQKLHVHLTYVLALSLSPPKTPQQTLEPLICLRFAEDIQVLMDIKVSVAATRFTPPEGMPWVQSVGPLDVREAVSTLDPSVQFWLDSDDASGPEQVSKALQWTADQAEVREAEEIVVVAGSLYLVADLYRLLQG
jgi:folylpolyglutamate synthase/dihydrofolate synthase